MFFIYKKSFCTPPKNLSSYTEQPSPDNFVKKVKDRYYKQETPSEILNFFFLNSIFFFTVTSVTV